MYLKDYLYILKKNIVYFIVTFMLTLFVYLIVYYTRPVNYVANCSIISKNTISDITLQVITGTPIIGEASTMPNQRIQKVTNTDFLMLVNKYANAVYSENIDMQNLTEKFSFLQAKVQNPGNYVDFLKDAQYRLDLRGQNEIYIQVNSRKRNIPLYLCAGFSLAFLQDGYNDANFGFKKQLEYYKSKYDEIQKKLKKIRETLPFDYVTRQEDLKQLESMRNALNDQLNATKKELDNKYKDRNILKDIVNKDFKIDKSFEKFASSKTKDLLLNLNNAKITMQSDLSLKNPEHPEIKKLFLKINTLQEAFFKSYQSDIINSINLVEENIDGAQQDILKLTDKIQILQDKIERVKSSLVQAKVYIKEEEQINRQIDIVVENINKYKTLLELNKSFVEIFNPPREVLMGKFNFFKYFPIILLLCLLLGFVAVFMIEYMETDIVSEIDVKKYLGYDCIGIVPIMKSHEKEFILNNYEKLSLPVGEIFKSITSVIVKKMNDLNNNCFIVSSIGRYEGKTTNCVNLAYLLSNAGYKCVVVDLDLITKNLTNVLKKYFNVNMETSYVSENLDYININWKQDDLLKKITTGEFDEIINDLKFKYDFVIIDAPPIMGVGETTFLIRNIKNLLLIVASGEVPKAKSRWFKYLVETLNIHIIGVILNKSLVEFTPTYYYYYKYGYYKK